jgi:hypothetical protein
VVVAPNITADGIALLRDRQAQIFVRHEFYWTDASYRSVGGK